MMQTNPQIEAANNLVRHTAANLFLTGKAGTGKTTFLKSLMVDPPKRMVVLAPTGVAAIHAGGATIHSFFQLDFGPYIPGTPVSKESIHKFRKEKLNIIRSIDLLVIDEISMVRADLLDSIDNVLRHIRRNSKPFGGVQLLMIGDIQQLSPVSREDEWAMLREYYETPYFFSSIALRKTNFTCVELQTIYRQEDASFIEILNAVRENRLTPDLIERLNQRYLPNFDPDTQEGYIRLTTHNATAQTINAKKLKELKGGSQFFKANIKGKFPEYSYPTDENLELKVGAQVMFIKNDPDAEKRFFNGKIGRVKEMNDGTITVEDADNGTLIDVKRTIWENMRYTLNEETKELEQVVDGTFEQFPLKTAWAITIHKSQGLTFEKAIIDAQASFSHGQVYVALSRCKTLEGMVLSSRIGLQSVKRDTRVDSFNQLAHTLQPDEVKLKALRKEYYLQLLCEQFDFNEIKKYFLWLKRTIDESLYKNYPSFYEQTQEIAIVIEELAEVGEKFQCQLQTMMANSTEDEANQPVKERYQKGATYFSQQIQTHLQPFVERAHGIDIDNKEVKKDFQNALTPLEMETVVKEKTLRKTKTHFSVTDYLHEKAVAQLSVNIEETKPRERKEEKRVSESSDILHPNLYKALRAWRKATADELGKPAFVVMHQTVLISLVNLRPQTEKELLKIKGMGKAKVSKYGAEILEIICSTDEDS